MKINTITLSKLEYEALEKKCAAYDVLINSGTEIVTLSLLDYEEMVQRISDLELLIANLTEKITLLKNGRSSKTSSTPPAHDYAKKYQKSLRIKSGLKSGGQIGHKGSTLEFSVIPDEVIPHYPQNTCLNCGGELSGAIFEQESRKQEIVIPIPIVPKAVEHQLFSCKCPHCGKKSQGEYPEKLKANVQYHPDVMAFVGYLSVYQYMPFQRITHLLKHGYGVFLSEGTIHNMLCALDKKAEGFIYPEIKRRIECAPVVGSDETGMKIHQAPNQATGKEMEQKRGWMWTFQSDTLTYLTVSFSRGFDTVHDLFINGFQTAVYVTDCWAAQLKVHAHAHQICLAHLLRDLNGFVYGFECKWSAKVKKLFKEAIALKRTFKPDDYANDNLQAKALEDRLDILLKQEPKTECKKVKAFIKRLNKNRHAILTFLYHHAVPPDNNGSERAIRNAKVKEKVSGVFRSIKGACSFVVLRSVLDTAIKNGQDPLNALRAVAEYIVPEKDLVAAE